MSDQVLLGTIALASLACEIAVWRGPGKIGHKLLWGVLSLVPVAGPVLFATVRKAPSVQGPGLQARRSDNENAADFVNNHPGV